MVMKTKKILAVVVCAALAATIGVLAGCSGGGSNGGGGGNGGSGGGDAKDGTYYVVNDDGTRTFTDSLGREVVVPAEITKIAPSGHTATQMLITFAPDKLVGLSEDMSETRAKYLHVDTSLPVFGAAFGNKGDMNKEAVGASGCEIIIDTGEPKGDLATDLDNLQEQLGIPCVHITTTLDNYGTAYRMLGELLGMEERGEELATYCDNAWKEVNDAMAKVPEDQRVNMAYLVGDSGLNAIAKGSYQGAIIELCANNVVEVEKASGSGLGNEISLEQIAVWNPELIVFQKGSIYDTVGDDVAWSGIDAIANNNYYEVPDSPYCWLNNPPTVNQIMGLQWLPRLLYPNQFDTSIQDVATEYYKLFYDYDLTDAEFQELAGKAIPHAAE